MGNFNFSQWSLIAKDRFPHLSIFQLQDLFHHRDQLAMTLEEGLNQLGTGYPLEYLTNHCDFGPLDLKIAPSLLIPREATYSWLNQAIEDIVKNHRGYDKTHKILELGTGSGAMTTLLAQKLNCQLTGVDCDPLAIEITQKNLKDHHLHNARIIESSWYSAIALEPYDFIFSNPPYCCFSEEFWMEGTHNESQQALISSQGGLKDIFTIISKSKPFRSAQTRLYLEHGAGQGQCVVAIGNAFGLNQWYKLYDHQGFWRATCLYSS